MTCSAEGGDGARLRSCVQQRHHRPGRRDRASPAVSTRWRKIRPAVRPGGPRARSSSAPAGPLRGRAPTPTLKSAARDDDTHGDRAGRRPGAPNPCPNSSSRSCRWRSPRRSIPPGSWWSSPCWRRRSARRCFLSAGFCAVFIAFGAVVLALGLRLELKPVDDVGGHRPRRRRGRSPTWACRALRKKKPAEGDDPAKKHRQLGRPAASPPAWRSPPATSRPSSRTWWRSRTWRSRTPARPPSWTALAVFLVICLAPMVAPVALVLRGAAGRPSACSARCGARCRSTAGPSSPSCAS